MAKNMSAAYEKDFYAWTVRNAALLRGGKLSEVDTEHVAEEIESMGKSEKRELVHRLVILMVHLLKWKYQPVRRGRSWELTIREQRLGLQELLEDSPSLKRSLSKHLTQAYARALLMAEKETGLSQNAFDKKCPFTLANIFDPKFFPGKRS